MSILAAVHLTVVLLAAKPAAAPIAAPPVAAAAAPDAVGLFKGSIQVPGQPLNIQVNFSRATSGGLQGTITIPVQNIRDMALGDVKLEGTRLRCVLPGIPGDPQFDGLLQGSTWAGTFTQGGSPLPFSVVRVDAQQQARELLGAWDVQVVDTMKTWDVPGAAMAIIKDGTVVHLQGYGVRELGKKDAVTPNTLFAIGSCSKAFTTFLMAQLVDEGKLEWTRPVQQVMPGFSLKDPYAASHLTPRDMVTHVSGLPRHDLVWYNNNASSRADLVSRLAFLDANAGFRETWQYNNLMFLAAGHLTERITGKSWEQSVKERIFQPLGMKRSNFSVKDSAKDGDHAEPHQERDHVVAHIPFRDISVVGPAGSINSSAAEMAQWVRVQLGAGSVDGKTLLPASGLAELHVPRAAIPSPPQDAAVPLMSYASGWMVDAYRGHRRVQHGGAIDGFVAQVTLLPDDGVGVVVLVNRGATGLPNVLANTAVDRLLSLPARDWSAEGLVKRKAAQAAEKEAEAKKEAVRVKGTAPSRGLDQFAGQYRHPGYGVVDVGLKDGALTAVYNGIQMPLEHWHYDVFRSAKDAREPDFEGLLFNFASNGQGEVASVAVPMESSAPEVVFERQPDPRLGDPRFLALLAGDYELAGKPLGISLRGTTLLATFPGQSPYELVANRGLGFSLKVAPSIHVEFVMAPDGKAVDRVRIIQPGAVMEATRMAARK